ncbi:MAG: hypothetical protein R3D05_10750 [Dongiaceae bacterium]
MSMRKDQPFTHYKFINYSMYELHHETTFGLEKGAFMFEAPFDWNSFWDLTTPEEAAAMFRDAYGPAAAQAAAQCASAARNDNRASDHAFWLAVAAALGGSDRTAPAAGPLQH